MSSGGKQSAVIKTIANYVAGSSSQETPVSTERFQEKCLVCNDETAHFTVVKHLTETYSMWTCLPYKEKVNNVKQIRHP